MTFTMFINSTECSLCESEHVEYKPSAWEDALGYLALIIVFFNSAAISAILFQYCKTRDSLKKSIILISSMVFSDLMLGGTYSIYFGLGISDPYVDEKDQDEVFLRDSFDFMLDFAMLNCLLHILALTVERFVATSFPLRHRAVTKKSLLCIALALWISAAVYAGLCQKYNTVMDKIAGCLVIAVGLIVIAVYAYILTRIRKITQHRLESVAETAYSMQSMISKSERKSIMYCALVVLVTLCCNYPIAIIILLNEEKPNRHNSIFIWLYFAKSAINPLLYLVQQLKPAGICKRNSSNRLNIIGVT